MRCKRVQLKKNLEFELDYLRTRNTRSYDDDFLSSVIQGFMVLRRVQNLSLEALLIEK